MTLFKNILSHGIDIIEIDRFRLINLGDVFYKKTFSKNELRYCLERKDPYKHLACRFAAKEAIGKALFQLDSKLQLQDIEVVKNKDGSVEGKVVKVKGYKILLSLSSSANLAMASSIIIKEEKNGKN